MIKHISWQDLHVTVGHQNKGSQFFRQISVLFKSANNRIGNILEVHFELILSYILMHKNT